MTIRIRDQVADMRLTVYLSNDEGGAERESNSPKKRRGLFGTRSGQDRLRHLGKVGGSKKKKKKLVWNKGRREKVIL